MPKYSLQQNEKGEWIMSADALVTRLRRHLGTLLPYRELNYNAQTCGYYTRVISQDGDHGTTHGPYYYVHMVGLARMTNALRGADKVIPSIMLYDRKMNYYPEAPLPFHLKWPVISKAYADMVRQLRGDGHTVILKQDPVPVTAAVTPNHVVDPWRRGLPIIDMPEPGPDDCDDEIPTGEEEDLS